MFRAGSCEVHRSVTINTKCLFRLTLGLVDISPSRRIENDVRCAVRDKSLDGARIADVEFRPVRRNYLASTGEPLPAEFPADLTRTTRNQNFHT